MSGFRVPSRGDGAQIVEIPFGHIALLLGWATFPTSRGVIFCVNVVPAPRYHLAEPPQVAGGYNVPSYTQLGAVSGTSGKRGCGTGRNLDR